MSYLSEELDVMEEDILADRYDSAIRTIGVLTSGGDAPGMNAAIRSVVRTAKAKGFEVRGIRRGYHGLLKEEIIELNAQDVSGIVQRGGTILQTARSKSMMTEEGQRKAAAILKKYCIDALVVIGGDGSYRGARALADLGVKVIGIPGTIDLDIACSDYTIGFDTAVNTAMEAIDKIRDSSTSHERCSIVEVMGRHAGYIALWAGMATGAECIFVPEKGRDSLDDIVKDMIAKRKRGHRFYVIINAEGIGNSQEMAREIEEATGIETRATILGYMQRGGSPSCKDRVFASKMGVHAVELLDKGIFNRVVATQHETIVDYDIHEALEMTKEFPLDELSDAKVLASR